MANEHSPADLPQAEWLAYLDKELDEIAEMSRQVYALIEDGHQAAATALSKKIDTRRLALSELALERRLRS